MITEVKPDNPWPCCPFMSGHPVPIAPPPGAVLQPNQMAVAPIRVPCAGGDCPLFDVSCMRCILFRVSELELNLAMLLEAIQNLRGLFEPPQGSPSPLMRVAEALEKIVVNQQTKKG